MKKRYIFLIILALIVVVAGIFAYVNKDNIEAIVYGLTTNEEQWKKDKLETDKMTEDAVKGLGVETIRPLTEEEAEKLSKGELTEEEAINLILGKTEASEITDSQSPSDGKQPTPDEYEDVQKTKEANDRIANLVGKMYVLKAQFTGDLKAVESWVIAEYVKLTPEERKSTAIKTKIGKEAVAKASALEASCDSQVDGILTEITTLLKETGQSTDLVTQIREAYENEKKLAKSYYMSKI